MLRKVMGYGLIAGLIAGAPACVMTLVMKDHLPLNYGMVIGYLTMLVALSAVFAGIKRHRDVDGGGVIRFWSAFGLGLAISFVASVIYALMWEVTMLFSQADFAETYAAAYIEQQKAKGISVEALAKLTADMQVFKVQYANPLYRLPMTFTEIFPVGVLVSLISAALLRNSRFLPARRE